MVEATTVEPSGAEFALVLPPPPPPRSGYLRAAAVQLDFQAAAVCQHVHLLEQPPMSLRDPRWPDWFAIQHQNALRSIVDWRKNTGRELRKLYCEYQQQRIAEVLGVCREWGVHLVVFPEYSVPPECLEDLLPLTRGMIVIFGTHAVEPKLLRDGFTGGSAVHYLRRELRSHRSQSMALSTATNRS